MIGTDLRPSRIITAQSIENALRVLLAIGGSTNALIHLTAIAGRVGVAVSLERLNALSDETPILVDLKPTGQHYMEDLFAAGGIGAVLRELKPLLHLDVHDGDRRDPRRAPRPRRRRGSTARWSGRWATLIRSSAGWWRCSARWRRTAPSSSAPPPTRACSSARAARWCSPRSTISRERIDDPDLDVTPDDFLVLQNAGPKSGYAMPEAGYLPIPGKLARAGVKDMVRISDARMSGTAYGTIVLHVSPEAAVGGPLAFVRDGDRIALSVAKRRLDLLVDEAELASAARAHRPATHEGMRGYARLYMQSVLQAEDGCDFDFLRKV